jgi:hypothetical protein
MKLSQKINAGFSTFKQTIQNCCGLSFVGKQTLFGTDEATPPAELALILEFNDGGASTVADPSNVADWNAFFILPGNGTPFTSVVVNGNFIELYGGTGISIKPSLFDTNANIISVNDEAQCVVQVGQTAFANSDKLTEYTSATTAVIGNNAFNGAVLLETIYIPLCTQLGDDCEVGGNGVFDNIVGLTITLTIPASLMTCNGGNPDGDIVILDSNNTVTIITV